MSWGIHKNPVAHIDTTPERVLEAMETTIWNPETQTFVPWTSPSQRKTELEKKTSKGGFLE